MYPERAKDIMILYKQYTLWFKSTSFVAMYEVWIKKCRNYVWRYRFYYKFLQVNMVCSAEQT